MRMHSELPIGEIMSNQQTNTWPSYPQHRAPDYPLVNGIGLSTLPSINALRGFPPTYDAYDCHTNDAQYSSNMSAVKCNNFLTQNGSLQFPKDGYG